MAYIKLASLNELPEGALIEVVQGDNPYALCNVAGEIRAISGVCPHHGGPLGQGTLDGSIVTCPWHAYEFDSDTGVCLFSDGLRIPTYPVRIEAGEILVDLPNVDLPENA
jgi:nitrite reductase (NADH) small subunit